MIRALSLFLVFVCALPFMAVAQGIDVPIETAEEAESFERLAERAETLAAREDASEFAMSRLRAELVVWRDRLLAETSTNSGRIATVDAQIAALGVVPEGAEEAPAIAARRAALIAQRQDLSVPGLLAQEAYARADGLIGEFDARSLQRQTAQLTVRGPTPLNPTHIFGAFGSFGSLAQVIGIEFAAGLTFRWESGQLFSALPRAVFLFLVGVVLLSAGRRLVTRWRAGLIKGGNRWRPLTLFMLSLVQIIVPVVGLLLVTQALQSLSLFGLRGGDVIAAIPIAGFFVIFGWWLARHVFPVGEMNGILGYDAVTRASGRRFSIALAWVIAFSTLFSAGMRTMERSAGSYAAGEWMVLVVLGVLFWGLGRVISTLPEIEQEEPGIAGRMRGLIGRFCTIVSVVSPILAAIGYGAAGVALLIPSILSVALIGLLILVQRMVQDLTRTTQDDDDYRGFQALIPVFISFSIYLLSLPIFALTWGMSVDELLELWTRFREGISVGETRISPTDFIMFAVVFAVGYILTRFIQGTLRKSVLPRTRLDLGGQNAVVAGFGYVGIMLAAIVAITSAGIDLSNIAIVAGALSVGIGFGLQTVVSNFVSGIILLIERPISEGDWIEVAGQMGYVRAISVRSTRIETFDRTDVIIPNADLVSGQVTNWTRGNLVGRVIVPVGVAYGSDVDEVTRILRGIAEAHPLVVMTPPPAVLFQGFGADALDFEIRAILRDVNYVLVTKSEMNHEIAKQFAEAGIEIPFAQRDIWLRNPEVLKDATT